MQLDPNLKTGRGEEENLETWRLKFLVLQETGMRVEQEQEEEKIARTFFRKIRSDEEGKSEREDLQLANIPRLGEKWDRRYEWALVLMKYINRVVCWEERSMRTNRVKFVLKVAAKIGEREGTEKIVDTKKESAEDYARKILEFLEAMQEARQKKKKEEVEVIKWNVSREVFKPTGEKGEADKNEREEGVQQMKLYPQSGLMVIHTDGLNK